MNGYCDWCEKPATMQRGEADICDACDERLEERAAREEERSMTRRQRMGVMRAREAGVD